MVVGSKKHVESGCRDVLCYAVWGRKSRIAFEGFSGHREFHVCYAYVGTSDDVPYESETGSEIVAPIVSTCVCNLACMHHYITADAYCKRVLPVSVRDLCLGMSAFPSAKNDSQKERKSEI